jgi:hypothetical protein
MEGTLGAPSAESAETVCEKHDFSPEDIVF